MPGSVANASPTAVLPKVVARAFSEAREVASRVVEYHDGTTERKAQVATSRRRWVIREALTATELAALRTFWNSVRHAAFYLYHPLETNPPGSYDATGVATAGRYTGVFRGGWNQSMGMARGEVGIEIEEVA